MKKQVYVWKESIYKNDFKCSCGNFLAKDLNVIQENVEIPPSSFRKWVYCKKCFKPVAYIQVMNLPEGAEGLMGNISEYERRMKN